MALSGNLKTFALTSILQLLSTDKKTGVLRINNDERVVKLFFQKGDIIFALGAEEAYRLGTLVCSEGIMTTNQMEKISQRASSEKTYLGKMLFQEGHVTKEKLGQLIRRQTESVALDLFLWSHGEFIFNDAQLHLQGLITTPINVTALVVEASRRVDEMSVITRHIKNDAQVLKLSGKRPEKQEVTLNAEEWHLLSLIDGQRTVGKLVAKSGMGRLGTYKMLYVHLQAGLVVHCHAAPPPKKSEKLDFSAVITVYHDVLQIIYHNLNNEIGRRAAALFEESKTVCKGSAARLLEAYGPNRPAATNIYEISRQLMDLKSYDQGHLLIVECFDKYIGDIFMVIPELLGERIFADTLKQIHQLMSHIREQFDGQPAKDHTITGVLQMLDDLAQRDTPPAKKKGDGIMGLFRKRGAD